MAIPVVTALCAGVHDKTYPATDLAPTKTITLAGSATNGPILEWEWSVLPTDATIKGGHPEGSAVTTGVKGDFTGGKSSSQNPTCVLDLEGGYCFTLRARNADGWSDHWKDADSAQAIVYILPQSGVRLPPQYERKYQYDLNRALVTLDNHFVVDTLTTLGAAPVTNYVSGTKVFVTAERATWYLDKVNVWTPTGLSVIAAAGSAGYWVCIEKGRWDDIFGEISQGTGTTALTYEEYRDTVHALYFMRHDQDDRLNFRFQFPHRWNHGTPVHPHLHYIPTGNPASAQNVYFQVDYHWANPGEAVLAAVGWTRSNATLTINNGAVYKPGIFDLVDITPGASARESAILLFTLTRLGSSSGLDTYTTNKTTPPGTQAANLAILYVDVHYQVNKTGSYQESPSLPE